jgi:hypothetical protein
VSRSIFALVNDMDRAYFGGGGKEQDQIGFIEANTPAISDTAMQLSRMC